jgi:hypothetical protein
MRIRLSDDEKKMRTLDLYTIFNIPKQWRDRDGFYGHERNGGIRRFVDDEPLVNVVDKTRWF